MLQLAIHCRPSLRVQPYSGLLETRGTFLRVDDSANVIEVVRLLSRQNWQRFSKFFHMAHFASYSPHPSTGFAISTRRVVQPLLWLR